ncbi:hypothetical protein B9Z45_15710 [Limnohabitans sp. 2KL-17]|nr:hypothetical protein B9Z45_15710 [Limnohabitans sp. 2KL-17]
MCPGSCEQTRPTGVGDATTGIGIDRAKQVEILDRLACLHLMSPTLGKRCFYCLPRHATSQHRQWVAQIDHLIQAVTEKVIGHGAAFTNYQKTDSIEYLFESFGYPDSPQITSVHEGPDGHPNSPTYGHFKIPHLN